MADQEIKNYRIYKENGLYGTRDTTLEDPLPERDIGTRSPSFSRLLYDILWQNEGMEIGITFSRRFQRISKYPYRVLTQMVVEKHNKVVRMQKAIKHTSSQE